MNNLLPEGDIAVNECMNFCLKKLEEARSKTNSDPGASVQCNAEAVEQACEAYFTANQIDKGDAVGLKLHQKLISHWQKVTGQDLKELKYQTGARHILQVCNLKKHKKHEPDNIEAEYLARYGPLACTELFKLLKDSHEADTKKIPLVRDEKLADKCLNCSGSGKMYCPAKLCVNGFWGIKSSGSRYGPAEIVSIDDEYVFKIPRVTIRNEGLGGDGIIEINITSYDLGKIVGTWKENRSINEKGDTDLGDVMIPLKNVKVGKNDPKPADFYPAISVKNNKNARRCETCNGTKQVNCPLCKNKVN